MKEPGSGNWQMDPAPANRAFFSELQDDATLKSASERLIGKRMTRIRVKNNNTEPYDSRRVQILHEMMRLRDFFQQSSE